MPSDFDDFTPASMFHYTGANSSVRSHLYLLQRAMMNAGFDGQRREWWHFSANDWKRYVPERFAKLSAAVVLPINESPHFFRLSSGNRNTFMFSSIPFPFTGWQWVGSD